MNSNWLMDSVWRKSPPESVFVFDYMVSLLVYLLWEMRLPL